MPCVVAISQDFAQLFITGYLDGQMKKFGEMGRWIKVQIRLASLCESPQRVSKWGMGCPFLEIKKGRKYGCAVQWQKYAVIYVVIYCQDTLGLTLKIAFPKPISWLGLFLPVLRARRL